MNNSTLARFREAQLFAGILRDPSLAANVIAAPQGTIRFFDPTDEDSLLKTPRVKPKAAPVLSEKDSDELYAFNLSGYPA